MQFFNVLEKKCYRCRDRHGGSGSAAMDISGSHHIKHKKIEKKKLTNQKETVVTSEAVMSSSCALLIGTAIKQI